ncbi:MAG: helix-turn-helix domain-containing protein [Pseudomonadota bacterium]
MENASKLIRDTEAAELLGCGRSTFWRWVANGVAPQPVRLGGVTRWRLGDIAALSQGSQPAPPVRKRRRRT